MKKIIILSVIVLGVLILSSPAFARIGVGVGTGKIQVDEVLKPGSISKIPSVVVINTGSEASNYTISVEYQENAPEMRPEKSWIRFSPKEFYLEAGERKPVEIEIVLPVKGVVPGDYFAFLSAHPVQEFEPGKTSIGVAAASRLYFTVGPANVFQAVYYRFANFYSNYHPWSTIILVIIAFGLLLWITGKKFKINISKKD